MSDSISQNPYNTNVADNPAGRTNVMAIIALVTGIIGFAIVPVVLGHIALSQIKRTGEGGKALAIVGLVLGYLGVAGWLIFWILFVVIGSIGTSVATYNS
ncbi:peptidyl-prolyl cis-trans isomerase B (cyclophilin B) [Pseudoclavibacter chungangensis]|uniref:DUF4190 domain-containing protein n=1 Tax=Pseudoclavibacter chungangensis TaxID=587635 RepID=UPI0015CD335D|nr:DUF4190 domain-containing protein [Pseudoclavibacter chungangensis]NYJ66543.1 peptidyl-prolyl cis-trans isomerase B (cyclophilin B) [Pseudoclavibacter chungangensis]